jgi:hypothetical membrane protein
MLIFASLNRLKAKTGEIKERLLGIMSIGSFIFGIFPQGTLKPLQVAGFNFIYARQFTKDYQSL